MNRFRAVLIGLALLGSSTLSAETIQEPDWSRVFLNDLEAARQLIADNHPGPVDDENPEFRRALVSAHEEAKSAALQVKSGSDYARAIRRFAGSFKDEHLVINVARFLEAAPEEPRAAQAEAMPVRPLGWSKLPDGTIWVDVPTFTVDEKEDVAAMRAMIDSLAAEMKQNRDWKLLVFDLRGNRGGSSQWGHELAATVFGSDWADAAGAWLLSGVHIEWRVSRDNIDSLDGIVIQQERRHGKDNPAAAQTRAFAQSMRSALAGGQALLRDPRFQTPEAPRPPDTPVPGRVVAVTSASCFSSCLDFLDVLLLHPAVVQVGQTTGVDTTYMESWAQWLPSGLAEISYPMKVYRNRKRKNNEAYVPKVTYEGALGDIGALRSWIAANHRRW